MLQDTIAKLILETLSGGRFEEWYQTKFEEYIQGSSDEELTENKILEDIKGLFKL